MTIQINSRKLLVAAFGIVMIAAACYLAFLVGQTTRITEVDATGRTQIAVQRAVDINTKAEVNKADDRVLATRKADAARLDKRVHRLNKMWRSRLSRAEREAREAGYSSGQSDGYVSGNAAGYASGSSDGYDDGIDDGIDQASDELTCSDDLDVPLPACSW